MEVSNCDNAYFHWCAAARQWKVQNFRKKKKKNLAPEQSQMALKALLFMAFGFVQYAL